MKININTLLVIKVLVIITLLNFNFDIIDCKKIKKRKFTIDTINKEDKVDKEDKETKVDENKEAKDNKEKDTTIKKDEKDDEKTKKDKETNNKKEEENNKKSKSKEESPKEQEQTEETNKNKAKYEEKWKSLFTDIERKYDNKECIIEEKSNDVKQESFVIGESDFFVPKSKPNPYRKIGKQKSHYLFDYLDIVLKQPILKELTRLFELVIKLPKESKNYKDIYSVMKIIHDKESSQVSQNLKLIQLGTILPKFSLVEYTDSINVVQLKKIIDDFNYGGNISKKGNYAKTMLDKYDFDGNGRLKINEFLTLAIYENVLTRENAIEPCSNCFQELIKEYIYPIYSFIDCKNSNEITSSMMWNKLKLLKRENSNNLYNFYNCGDYRTSSINDFVLEAGKKHIGTLSLEEFSAGILVAYVNNYTKGLNVEENLDNKLERWSNNGLTDIKCEKMKSFK